MTTTWLIDGFNVLHAGWTGEAERSGWWKGEHRAALVERTRGFRSPDPEPPDLWLVFDGDDPRELAGPPRLVYAPSADDWIVRRVKEQRAAAAAVVVVTDDRKLADRARHHGARIVSAREFLARCRGEAGSPG